MEFTFNILHPIYDAINDEVDVHVEIALNQTKFHVTFVTYKRAEEIFREKSFSVFTNTLFVEKLTEEQLHRALKNSIENGKYLSVFYPINEQARIALFKKLTQEKVIE